jgi:hypothetical protein
VPLAAGVARDFAVFNRILPLIVLILIPAMADVILLGICIYLFYRFMVGFAIPVYKTTRRVRQQFGDMHARAQKQPDPQSKETGAKKAGPTPKAGEYIDFEEVK